MHTAVAAILAILAAHSWGGGETGIPSYAGRAEPQ